MINAVKTPEAKQNETVFTPPKLSELASEIKEDIRHSQIKAYIDTILTPLFTLFAT